MSASSIAQFRALVSREQQASHPDVRLALVRLAGESKEKLAVSAPESADFFDLLRQSLGRLKGSANADLRIGCLLDCASFFYVSGDIIKGVVAARDGITLGRAVRNDVLTSKAYSYLGYLLADSGAVAQGIEAYVAAIDLAKKAGNLERRAYSIVNLAVALFYSGQYEQAVACLDFAARISVGLPAGNSIRLSSLSNKAMCFLHLNRIEEGIAAAEQCLSESSAPESSTEILSKVIRECNYIHLLLESGNSKSAAQRLPVVREFVLKLKNQKTNVMAGIAEGLMEIHRGDAHRGIAMLL